MQREHVRTRKQLVKRDPLSGELRMLVPAVADDVHPERGRELCRSAADHAERQPRKLDERRIPEAEIRAVRPASLVYLAVVMPNVHADLQQQRHRHLRNGVRAVCRNIAHGDPASLSRRGVDHVIARGEHADKLQVLCLFQLLLTDAALVDEHGVRADQPLCDQLLRRAVIDRDCAEFTKRIPAEVAGIDRVSVQNDDLHVCLPCFCRSESHPLSFGSFPR